MVADPEAGDRLTAAGRRDALLDATQAIVLEQGVAAVTMGTVASRGGVARALVYKHFANRDEILRALYHREAQRVDRLIARRVAAATGGFEAKFRACVRGIVDHVADAAPVFRPLRAASADEGFGATQREWDRRTVAYFAQLAADDFALDVHVARSAMSMLLAGVEPLIWQARGTRGRARRDELQDRYVGLVLSALRGLSAG